MGDRDEEHGRECAASGSGQRWDNEDEPARMKGSGDNACGQKANEQSAASDRSEDAGAGD